MHYWIIDDRSKNTLQYLNIFHNGYETNIYVDDTLENFTYETASGERIYPVSLVGDNAHTLYSIGDRLELWLYGRKSIWIEITDILPGEYTLKESENYVAEEEIMRLYCSEAVYQEIDTIQALRCIWIQMDDRFSAWDKEKEILALFMPRDIDVFQNYNTGYETELNRIIGMNLLYTTLSALLFAFFAIITTLSLIDYAASHRETIRLLHMQGASHRSIVAAFVEIMLPPGLLTCAAVWAIVTPVEREYYRLRGYSDALMAKLDLRMIDDPWYLLAAVAVVAVFVAPVMGTVIRELRRLDRG